MKKSELSKLTLVELKSYSKENGIKKYSTLNKEELVNYILKYKKVIQKAGNNQLIYQLIDLNRYYLGLTLKNIDAAFQLYSAKMKLYNNIYVALVYIIKGKSAFTNIQFLEDTTSAIYMIRKILYEISNGFFNLIEDHRVMARKGTEPFTKYVKPIYEVAILTANDPLKENICKVAGYWFDVCSSSSSMISRKIGKVYNKLFRSHTISSDTQKFMNYSKNQVKQIYNRETAKNQHLNKVDPYLMNAEVVLFSNLVNQINQKIPILQLQDKVQTINLNDYLTIEKQYYIDSSRVKY
jgi:hypothetical protein